jgi:hypothetical protein
MNVVRRRSIGRAALIAGVVSLGLSVEILLTNVVFPTNADDESIQVLASYLCVFAALFVAGFMAARAGAGPRGQAAAARVRPSGSKATENTERSKPVSTARRWGVAWLVRSHSHTVLSVLAVARCGRRG